MNTRRVTHTEERVTANGTRITINYFTPRKNPLPTPPNPRTQEAINVFGSQRGENQ